MIHRHFLVRPRLSMALLAGLVALALMPSEWRLATRALIAWDIAVWLYLAMMITLMARADTAHMRRSAAQQTERAGTVLTLVSLAAVASLIAIISELAYAKHSTGPLQTFHFVLAGITILGSWLLMPVVFATHYAHDYYNAGDARPLLFPDKPKNPTYWDFLYVSITIAVAAQISDVAAASPAMRRVVTGQSLLAFLFNTSILAFSINIAASLF